MRSINYKQQISQNINQFNKMINQITCNSNNAIELSRGELLNWLNFLLKLNYTKIEHLGTGAAYCQLLDMIYPGKVPLSKVNWKTKTQYQHINNFKILQQSFTKLNIMKHIDVQKMVKCKYQDNLQFLQWFKKIFDTTGCTYSKEYDAVGRRGEKGEKENKISVPLSILNHGISCVESSHSKDHSGISSHENSKQSTDRTIQEIELSLEKQLEQEQFVSKGIQKQHTQKIKYSNIGGTQVERLDQKLVSVFVSNQNEEKEFYLRKIKEIEYLMDSWNLERKSQELIENIRKIILAVPKSQWRIENGEFSQGEGLREKDKNVVMEGR